MELRKVISEIIAQSAQDTAKLAEWLASRVFPGSLLALDGDLGAGKTTFSQAYAAAIGVPGIVNSPTFTIIKEYCGSALPFYHMDVYRVSVEEADELGLDDYFYGDGTVIVEWASIIDDLLPPARLDIYMEHTGEESRRIRLTGTGEPYAQWCEEWNRMGETVK